MGRTGTGAGPGPAGGGFQPVGEGSERPVPEPDRMPAARNRHGAWRSLVAHLLWEQRVGGSNPSAPTNSGGSIPDLGRHIIRRRRGRSADLYYRGQLAIMRVPNAVCTNSGHRPE
jgi:hypothetical protein